MCIAICCAIMKVCSSRGFIWVPLTDDQYLQSTKYYVLPAPEVKLINFGSFVNRNGYGHVQLVSVTGGNFVLLLTTDSHSKHLQRPTVFLAMHV